MRRTLAQALQDAVGEIPTRRWGLFEATQTSEARTFAMHGNYAVQVSPTGDEGWLLAQSRDELVRACACIGASPKPVRHPIDRRGCAEVTSHGLRSARANVQNQRLQPEPEVQAPPTWRSFPSNQRENAVAWAAAGQASLFTQDGDEPIRWMLVRWPIARRLPKLLGIRKPATQDRQLGWIRLDDEALWREAFELCAKAGEAPASSTKIHARLGVVGVRQVDRLPVPLPPRKVWDRLCMSVARKIELSDPVEVLVGACPWTDAAVLWIMRQLAWPCRMHLYLPAPWDLDAQRFAVGDADAYVERIKASPAYRPSPGSEESARRFFLAKDLGNRLNDWHWEVSGQVGFNSLAAIAEIVTFSIHDPEHQLTYSEHEGLRAAGERLARDATQMVVTSFDRKTLEGHARRATQLCSGQLIHVHLSDLAGIRGLAPP